MPLFLLQAVTKKVGLVPYLGLQEIIDAINDLKSNRSPGTALTAEFYNAFRKSSAFFLLKYM